ncbi:MAG TPA: YebC/PmpR family DNA-binding transcriptional regulator [Candidatus Paceibacterota bacterium]
MSGHNKWSQIKHQKGAEDAKKSKLYSMMGRLVTIQARLAGGDMSSPALRAAIEKARKANVTTDVIERAVGRGSPSTGSGQAAFEEVLYEAYGPGGVALVIEGITDSRNRTSNEIKRILADNGGSLGGPGATTWAFARQKDAEGNMTWEATTKIPVPESEQPKLGALIDLLENHDDIKTVTDNAE